MSRDTNMREKILNAVEELVTTKGVNNFSLRDISRYLYISTGSLYYHFKTKDEIILAIIERHFNQLEKDYIEWLKRHKESNDLSKEHFIDIVLYKGTRLFNNSKIHIYLINECMRDNEKLRQSYVKFVDSWYSKLLEGVKQVYGDIKKAEGLAYLLLLLVEGSTIKVALGVDVGVKEEEMKNLLKAI